jgi:hypothetical protein
MRPGTTPHKVSPLKPYIGTNTSALFGQTDVAIAGASKGNILDSSEQCHLFVGSIEVHHHHLQI